VKKKFEKLPFSSFNWAIKGIVDALREEPHLKFHFAAAVVVIIASFVFRLNKAEWFAIVFAITIVLLAELVNSLVERLCNIITSIHDTRIQKIKDISAGMVLIAVISALVIGYIVFYPHMSMLWNSRQKIVLSYHVIVLISLIITLFLVVLIKSIVSPEVPPLYGGMPSGHSAIAFSLWALVVIKNNSLIVDFSMLIVALLVAESRLSLGIHTISEVVIGSFLGISVSYIVYLIFGL